MVDTDAYRSHRHPNYRPRSSHRTSNAYLSSQGHQGTVTVNATTVTVTVTITVDTRFLPGPIVVSATESASAVAGI